MQESPDINSRKLNGKAGVQLAPIAVPQVVGRQSMMSTDAEKLHGSDSHPILRV
jgi:hypothetical protein